MGTRGVLDMCLCFGCGGLGGVYGVYGVGGEWRRDLGHGQEGRGGVMSVWVVSLTYLCRWQVQVNVYCARRITAHLRCTQCSILLHLIDICFLPCIGMRQISQIQTCLRVVVGPGFVSTSPAFMRSSVSAPPPPKVNLVHIARGGRFLTQFAQQTARTAVTAPPLVGYVDWSIYITVNRFIKPAIYVMLIISFWKSLNAIAELLAIVMYSCNIYIYIYKLMAMGLHELANDQIYQTLK